MRPRSRTTFGSSSATISPGSSSSRGAIWRATPGCSWRRSSWSPARSGRAGSPGFPGCRQVRRPYRDDRREPALSGLLRAHGGEPRLHPGGADLRQHGRALREKPRSASRRRARGRQALSLHDGSLYADLQCGVLQRFPALEVLRSRLTERGAAFHGGPSGRRARSKSPSSAPARGTSF